MKKGIFIFLIFAKAHLAHWQTALYRIGFFCGVIYLFNSIWSQTNTGFKSGTLLLFLILCQSAILSLPTIHRTIFQWIQDQNLEVWLSDPFSVYYSLRVEAMAQFVIQFFVLLLTGLLIGRWINQDLFIEQTTIQLLWIPVLGLLALFSGWLLITILALIGMASRWVGNPGPIYLIIQKLMITTGGVLTPLLFYPESIQKYLKWTPFAASINNLGEFVFQTNPFQLQKLGTLFFYVILFELLILKVSHKLKNQGDTNAHQF